MQISVVKPTEDIINKLQDVMDIVYQVYGIELVNAYAVKDDGEFGEEGYYVIYQLLSASGKVGAGTEGNHQP